MPTITLEITRTQIAPLENPLAPQKEVFTIQTHADEGFVLDFTSQMLFFSLSLENDAVTISLDEDPESKQFLVSLEPQKSTFSKITLLKNESFSLLCQTKEATFNWDIKVLDIS